MNATLPLEKMTLAEKLRAMEALWSDLCRDESRIESPEWHADVLHDRRKAVESGQETFVDWDAAKRDLRRRLS